MLLFGQARHFELVPGASSLLPIVLDHARDCKLPPSLGEYVLGGDAVQYFSICAFTAVDLIPLNVFSINNGRL